MEPFKVNEELAIKLDSLEKRVKDVIEKVQWYAAENCTKASVKTKCFSLSTEPENKEKR